MMMSIDGYDRTDGHMIEMHYKCNIQILVWIHDHVCLEGHTDDFPTFFLKCARVKIIH